MKTVRHLCFIVGVSLIGVPWGHLAFAEVAEIRIQDTSGYTRGVSEIADEEGVVEFSVVDDAGTPAENVEVTLTNSEGKVIKATAVGGVVTFTGVIGGTWTVASTAAGLTFTSVTITGVGAAAAAAGVGAAAAAGGAAAAAGSGAVIGGTALAVGGVAAVGGATVAVANTVDNGSNDDDPALSPST